MSKQACVVALLLGALVVVSGCGESTLPQGPGPVVMGISPVVGPLVGGTEVTITGQNFTPDMAVTLADQTLVDLTYVDAQTVTGKTPAAVGGTEAGVLVSNSRGLSYLLGVFYYIPAPTLTSVSPNFGPPPGGIVVTLTGTGFEDYDAGPNTVMVGGLPATNVVTLGDTTIECVIPSGLGPATITVTNARGTATKRNAYRYFPPPTVQSITPNAGTPLGGTSVTITGTGFVNNAPGVNLVSIGGSAALNVAVIDDSTITCETPPRDGIASVAVSNANGDALLVDAYTYYPRPTLTGVSPATGTSEGGVVITLTGSGFLNNFPGTNTVKIGGVNATGVTVVDDATITCTTPASAVGTLGVSVSNANGTATLPGVYTATLSALLASDGPDLYKLNITNGAATKIGSIGYTVIAMATHPDGTIYAVTTDWKLIKLNLSNGAGTEVAALSTPLNSAYADMTFKGTSLYAGEYWGRTYLINTSSGSVTTKNTNPYYYGGRRKCGFEYFNGQWHMFTYDGYYDWQMDPEVGGYPNYTYGFNLHAVRCLGVYKGVMYGVNCQAGSAGGSLSLFKFNGGTSTTTLGSVSGIIALTGTN